MTAKRITAVILVLLITLCYFLPASATTPTPTPDSMSLSDFLFKPFGWLDMFKDIENLYQIMQNLLQLMTDFMNDGLVGVVERLNGITLEAFLNKTGIDGAWIFLTPKLINFEWIRLLWWTCYIIGIISLVIGLAVSLFKLLSGKGDSHSKNLLLAFIVAIVGSSLSLLISDKIIEFSNSSMNAFVNKTLVEEYKRPENQNAILVKNLDETKIGFDSFDGRMLCKVAFGASLTDNSPLYTSFMTKNGGGGIIIMWWAMLCLTLTGISNSIRYGTMGILGGGASIWFSICTWTGDIKPALGYTNLFVRSIILSYFFDFAWFASVYINRWAGNGEFANIGGQIATCILFSIALLITIFFWFKWVVKAAVKPITLAGYATQEWVGNKAGQLGKAAQTIGNRFGIKSLEYAGGRMRARGEERAKIAKEKAEGKFDVGYGSVSDRLRDAEDQYTRNVYMRESKRPIMEDVQRTKINIPDISSQDSTNSPVVYGGEPEEFEANTSDSTTRRSERQNRGQETRQRSTTSRTSTLPHSPTVSGGTVKCVSFTISNKLDHKQLLDEITQKAPNSTIQFAASRPNEIIVKQESAEEVNKIIDGYYKKMPYWADNSGGYYYYSPKMRRVIKHIAAPINGRYMGYYAS